MYPNWDTFISLLSHPIPSLCCYHSEVLFLKRLYDVVGCNRENKAHQRWQSIPVFYSCPIVCPSLCFLALCGHFFPWQMFLLPALAWLIFSPAVFVFAEYVLLCIHLTTSTPQSFGNNHLHSLSKNAVNSLHSKEEKEISELWSVTRQWFCYSHRRWQMRYSVTWEDVKD